MSNLKSYKKYNIYKNYIYVLYLYTYIQVFENIYMNVLYLYKVQRR